MVGTFAAACGPTGVTALIGLMVLGDPGGVAQDVGKATYILILPLVLAFCVVLLCSIIFGIPATYILHRLGKESRANYAAIGAVAGFVAPVLLVLVISGEHNLLVILIGMFSGGVTGWVWGTERDKLLGQFETW